MTLNLPLRLTFWRLAVKHRVRRAWLGRTAPHKLYPETLYSSEGEPPYFVRADLASTPHEAAEYLARDSEMTVADFGRGMDPIEEMATVAMVERPCSVCRDPDCHEREVPCPEADAWYATVPDGTPGAVRYWRWSW